MQVRHFIETDDFTKEEYLEMLKVIRKLKEAEYKGIRLPLLKDQSLGMMFDQPSTRTRVSFEAGMTQLGGHALYLETKTLHCGEDRETIKDTAEVLSGMCDAIEIRTESQDTIIELAKWATVPVFSGMSSKCMHPTQALCDLFTMTEYMPEGKKIEDLVYMFIGDNSVLGDNIGGVCRTEARLLSKMGVTFISCAPKEAEKAPEDVAYCKAQMEKSGGKFIQTNDPYEYIDQVDFIATDAWWYHGSDHLKDKKIATFFPKYSINKELLSKAPAHCKVMHNLPGNRGYEISDEVWDGPQSILIPQAENRLHTEKGLLVYFMYPLLKEKEKLHTPDEVEKYKEAVEALVLK